jgi:signal transduction histidine kinase
MLGRTLQLDDKSKERVARIIEATKHGRDIVRNVLAYCRKEQQTLSAVDLVPVVAQAVSLIHSAMPPSIKVERDIRAETAPIMGDAGQIHQVLLNLANNAKDAMAGTGTLSLSLAVVPAGRLEPPRAQDDRADPFAVLDETRPHVEIRVADTGSGMRPATMAKIFDPFFTTKPVGQGTGLGLSVVQGIVKAMGGAIAVDSELGVGTTFRIAIPLALPPC